MVQKKKKKPSVKTEIVVDDNSKIGMSLSDERFLKGIHKASSESEDDECVHEAEEMSEQEIYEMQHMQHFATQAPITTPPLIYSDKFRVISDAFQPEFVAAIDLPKMILKKMRDDEQTINEKSVIMVYLSVTQENIKKGCFEQLYRAARKGPIKMQLVWLDGPKSSSKKKASSEPEELSVWKFEDARIHGIDFGTAMVKRADINMITVEITYNNVSIDGVSL